MNLVPELDDIRKSFPVAPPRRRDKSALSAMNLASSDLSSLKRNYIDMATLSVDVADLLLARLERADAESKLDAEIKVCHDAACPCNCHSNAA